ncbi:5-formyltetrahydrofolate cyclo-ligase [Rhodococcus sp. D2-41]|uniref:5-formyltetrahydrofolate cyclo-ligase n=1 Tax=Speluncibacter jeojiensis TaxID=2710754 RepID=A0A9X4RDN6_9ACTN|nr:5-formyltetrahydrofolate cyclo-ligase [Rhodococcus sp. D2-41]MDG3012233.1 5-formyltetrahydrofolate cyclo-ligase [Rhodococcus sp. D2-41]MDG3014798.1 5-formyltetrahydrofolate cyclo-ligase [Corynebacteriales bacterium D3-21]
MYTDPPRPDDGKTPWREWALQGRGAVPAQQREREATELARIVAAGALPCAVGGRTVCAYVPSGTEPGSLALLDALRSAGARVLLPVTGPPGPLQWGEFSGATGLRAGRFGLREPVGPPLAPEQVAEAALVLVPALAVDRGGVRLGRGAGYYDRTLVHAGPGTVLMAVVRDDEVVPELPADRHDIRVGWALTPSGPVRLAPG